MSGRPGGLDEVDVRVDCCSPTVRRDVGDRRVDVGRVEPAVVHRGHPAFAGPRSTPTAGVQGLERLRRSGGGRSPPARWSASIQSLLAGVDLSKKRCSTLSCLPSTSRVGSAVNTPATPPYPVVCSTVGRSKPLCHKRDPLLELLTSGACGRSAAGTTSTKNGLPLITGCSRSAARGSSPASPGPCRSVPQPRRPSPPPATRPARATEAIWAVRRRTSADLQGIDGAECRRREADPPAGAGQGVGSDARPPQATSGAHPVQDCRRMGSPRLARRASNWPIFRSVVTGPAPSTSASRGCMTQLERLPRSTDAILAGCDETSSAASRTLRPAVDVARVASGSCPGCRSRPAPASVPRPPPRTAAARAATRCSSRCSASSAAWPPGSHTAGTFPRCPRRSRRPRC